MTDLLIFSSTKLPSPIGLPNTSGIHCYWNATLQALLSCPQFIQIIDELNNNENTSIISAFHDFITGKISNMELYKIYIKSLHLIGKPVSHLQELVSNQQCAGETFSYIMEQFERVPEITRLFEHRYIHELACLRCKYVSRTKTTSILFEITPTQNLAKELYNNIEVIQDYKCENCKDSSNKPKHSRLTMLPELLVIVVKNYVWNEHGGTKQMEYTAFPETLTFPPLRYRAVAYIDHFGQLNAGHYTATCLRRNSVGQLGWFNFNDNIVSLTQFAPSSATYIVFYSYDPNISA